MEKQTAVEEKQHCSICGKEGFVMRLQIPGGEATPPICSECFDERVARVKDDLGRVGHGPLKITALRLTEARLIEDRKYLQAVAGNLHDAEQMLAAFVYEWAGRSEVHHTAVRQQITKAMVAVQSAQSRIAKAFWPFADIRPDEDGLFVTH